MVIFGLVNYGWPDVCDAYGVSRSGKVRTLTICGLDGSSYQMLPYIRLPVNTRCNLGLMTSLERATLEVI